METTAQKQDLFSVIAGVARGKLHRYLAQWVVLMSIAQRFSVIAGVTHGKLHRYLDTFPKITPSK